MRFKAFRIKNYRGINDTTIELGPRPGTVHTLVGLNESGKTTILEAINSFRKDVDGIHALAQQTSVTPATMEELIPKRKKDNFNDSISVSAFVELSRDDIEQISDKCRSEHEFQINLETFSNCHELRLVHKFENSEYKKTSIHWNSKPEIKRKNGRKFLEIDQEDREWTILIKQIIKLFPRVVYFPTFLFNFPDNIQLCGKDEGINGNKYLLTIINEALHSVDDKLNIKDHIVDRIKKVYSASPGDFQMTWPSTSQREQVDIVLSRLAQLISNEIFSRWKEVLGVDIGGKGLVIESFQKPEVTGDLAVFLKLRIKDGHNFYKISERSLGFRWFFCFLLFTRFFEKNDSGRCVFLFDEPASNLHGMAQSKLLESLRVIADGRNDIIYSTHSHHLIEPLWLESTYVITNGKLVTDSTFADPDFGIEESDIKATKYRRFVGENAEKSHYFQPILDKLQAKPSKLEATHRGVLVEGKSDYYVLNWYKKYHNPTLQLDFVPIGGVQKADALLSLYLGLCYSFVFLVDGDEAGKNAKSRYLESLPIEEQNIVLLPELAESGLKEIEDLISEDMKSDVAKKFDVPHAGKKQLQRAFAEALAADNNLPDDQETIANLERVCSALVARLDAMVGRSVVADAT